MEASSFRSPPETKTRSPGPQAVDAGHDRGAKIVARALRDAGYEVIYTGIRQKVGVIAELALQEDVDLVGLSVLSGAHLGLAREVLEALRRNGLDDVKVVIGGTIPASDSRSLLDMGVAAVFPTGTSIEEVVAGVDSLWKQDDVVSA